MVLLFRGRQRVKFRKQHSEVVAAGTHERLVLGVARGDEGGRVRRKGIGRRNVLGPDVMPALRVVQCVANLDYSSVAGRCLLENIGSQDVARRAGARHFGEQA